MSDLITTPFGATSTALEVIHGVDLSGKRAIVTGGASGIGVETARALASAGADVTLAVRNLEAGEQTKKDIVASTGNDDVHVAMLELVDRRSVRAFVDAWTGPLHILVNNAGVMAAPLMRTAEGWEMQLATNHLGHFNLATGLHAALKQAGDARVVSVSSTGHLNGTVDFDDLFFQHGREYDPWVAYGQSKTANILFAVEATKRWAADGISVNALHPGGIHTNLQRHVTEEALAEMRARISASPTPIVWKDVEQGAATSVLLAASPLVAGVSGRYFEDCNEPGPNVEGTRRGVAAYALDPDTATRLWDVSLDLLAS